MSDALVKHFLLLLSFHFYYQGAAVDDRDNNNKTPHMLAVGRKHRMLIKFLEKKDSGNWWDWRQE